MRDLTPSNRLRLARLSANLTQEKLAEALGVSVPTLYRMESDSGQREPTVDELVQVGLICEVPEEFMRDGWSACDQNTALLGAINALRDEVRQYDRPRRRAGTAGNNRPQRSGKKRRATPS